MPFDKIGHAESARFFRIWEMAEIPPRSVLMLVPAKLKALFLYGSKTLHSGGRFRLSKNDFLPFVENVTGPAKAGPMWLMQSNTYISTRR